MITIDSIDYDVPVISLKRRADFLDKFAERTVDGKLHREPIGVYKNFQLTLGSTFDRVEYQRLWNKLTEPVAFHTVTVPEWDGEPYTFTAYFSNVGDELRRDKDGKVYWHNLTVNFIARSKAA